MKKYIYKFSVRFSLISANNDPVTCGMEGLFYGLALGALLMDNTAPPPHAFISACI